MKTKQALDMCNGPFLKKILLFSLPIIVSGLLQVLFTAADTAVLGQFAGDAAISAVGSTSSLINSLIAIAMGVSNGAGVVVAQCVGAKDKDSTEKAVHNAMALSVVMGVLLSIVCIIFSKDLLILIKSPIDVIDLSALYLKIFFLGLPFQLIYNFGSSILRAIGDTARPLIFLTVAGVLNVILNLLFVIVFNMTVAGVALATIISQGVSAVLVVIYMLKIDNECKLIFSKLRFNKHALAKTLYIGIPSGIQGMIFSTSNVLLQSTINSFGSLAMAGSAAANTISSIVYVPMNAIHFAATNFIGQNTGAKKYHQIKKLTSMILGIVTVVGVILSAIVITFGHQFISVFTTTPEAMKYGYIHLFMVSFIYFLCGLMEVTVGSIRGMGKSVSPMIISIFGVCIVRIIWILVFFPLHPTYPFLFLSYPISWAITFAMQYTLYRKTINKLIKTQNTLP